MEFEPKLIEVATPADPAGLVVVLHGGASRGREMMVSPTQLSVLRMIPIAKRIARADRRLAVYRMLNSRRGWDPRQTPVHDVHWALEHLRESRRQLPPVCLVGHSLGGRAALFAAARPEVRSAVALAPWFSATDAPAGLDGKPVLIVHGQRDRIASSRRAAGVAERLAARGPVDFVPVEGARHAMLRHHARFTAPAAEFAVRTLLGDAGRAATGSRS